MNKLILSCLMLASINAYSSTCIGDYLESDSVLLGDSISTGFSNYSKTIQEVITDPDSASILARYAIGGATSHDWLSGFSSSSPFWSINKNVLCQDRSANIIGKIAATDIPSFPDIIKNKRAKNMIIALGTNDVNNHCASTKDPQNMYVGLSLLPRAEKLAKLASQKSQKCIWVLPITYKSGTVAKNCNGAPDTVASAIEKLKEEVGRYCQTIDTSEVCGHIKINFDGIGVHPLKPDSVELGRCIGEEIKKIMIE